MLKSGYIQFLVVFFPWLMVAPVSVGAGVSADDPSAGHFSEGVGVKRGRNLAVAGARGEVVSAPLRFAQRRGGTTTIAKSRPKSTPKAALLRPVVARRAAIEGDRSRTVFTLEISRGVTAEVFTLANPFRVIIDLPDVKFKLSEDAGRKGRGLISAYRFGLFAARKARLVLDTVLPVVIEKAEMHNVSGGGVELKLVLRATDRKSFGSGTGATRSGPKVKRKPSVAESAPRGAQSNKPVVVIDAGHGGIDPGALGTRKIHEKTIVLAVAKRVRAKLKASGRYLVKLTRTRDVFVSLDGRVEFSQESKADVFVSLHADSIADTRYSRTVRGATVYTLSERASDEQARLMAEKENSADAIAGLDVSQSKNGGQVRSILIDLLRRETSNFSTDLSNALVAKLGKVVALSRKPRRSAAFKVLKQTRTPSVLIELGYLSNAHDAKMMAGAKWQTRAANSIAAAIDSYFARRSQQAR